MLEISSKNGSRTDPLIGPKVVSRSCQTDDFENNTLFPSSTVKTNDLFTSDKDKNRGIDSNHLFLQKELSSTNESRKGLEHDSLSDTKDKKIGTIRPSTSPGKFQYRLQLVFPF